MSLRLFKKRAGKIEPTYYMRRKKKMARDRAKTKYINMVIFLLIIPAITILYHAYSLKTAQDKLIESISNNQAFEVLKTRTEAKKAKNEILSKYDDSLAKLGNMGQAIKRAGIEFGESDEEAVKLIGLMAGIANAESSMGTKYVVEYDKNCHNLWGLKGGNMAKRDDGSSLRCFISDDAGARTMAKTLKLYYLNEGRDTPEKIVTKYVGLNWGQYHDVWVQNVNKIYNK